MEYFLPGLIGLLLLIFNVLVLYVIISDIKRIIVCTKKVDARIKTVSERVDEHKDSETGKIEYRYSYDVTFEYDYNGQTYKTTKNYSKRNGYDRGVVAEIKINPHKPEEIWTKGELKGLILVCFLIPIFAFFDYVYVMFCFEG